MKTGRNDPWMNLVAAARRAPSEAVEDTPPAGFSTRVLALSAAAPVRSAFDLLGLKALVLAGVLACVCAVATLPGLLSGGDLDDALADDPTAELLDLF
jgi:hypothetical protein